MIFVFELNVSLHFLRLLIYMKNPKNYTFFLDKSVLLRYDTFCRYKCATTQHHKCATVAQLVEHLLAKEEVAGSSPVCR